MSQSQAIDNRIVVRFPPMHEKQSELFWWMDEHPEAHVLVAPCGTKFGKALSLDTKIPTPLGWKIMGDLKVGDLVFDENGEPTRIFETTPILYGHDCYEVNFSDGSRIVADAGHKWITETHCERKNQARVISENDRAKSTESEPRVRTTQEIFESQMISIGGKSRPNHSIRNLAGPIQYEEKNLPIDPYVLGVWLGDGTRTTGQITIADSEVIDEIQRSYQCVKLKADYLWNCYGLRNDLRINGLLNNKHIPRDYVQGSPKQRLRLLQGLMDTDGTISKNGHCCFDNTEKVLVDGVAEILVSFGIKINRASRIPKLDGVEHKRCYRVMFTTDLQVFKIKRKSDRLRDVSLKSKQRLISSVVKIPSVPVKCISVENPTSLFLAGESCIPTHNSFGCAAWLLSQALSTPGLYCVWIAPTYLKCRIGYRYMKAMLPDLPWVDPVDGRLEIKFANGSFIKFLHGRDAEVTVEGEAVDRFVLDESGKLTRQLWYSLFTTITQTMGYGICTGTPRGFNWYWDVFKQAQAGDSFFCWRQFRTEDSPYVNRIMVEKARRILPPALFNQYYLAMFVSAGSVFGDLEGLWDEELTESVNQRARLWLHPSVEERQIPVVHGVDWAKKRDYTVFYSTNEEGVLVGLWRYRGGSYPLQVKRLEKYTEKFGRDQLIRYDQTGVGEAVGDLLAESDVDATIDGVYFTNKSKQEMITRLTMAIETGYHRAPRITKMEHEFASYEVKANKSGSHSYAAPEGEHDDIVSAGMLSVSGVYSSAMADEAERMLEDIMDGVPGDGVSDFFECVAASDLDLDKEMQEDESDDEIDDLEAYEG